MTLRNIKHLGKQTEEKLNEAGLYTVEDIVSRRPQDIAKIAGIRKTRASIIHANAKFHIENLDSDDIDYEEVPIPEQQYMSGDWTGLTFPQRRAIILQEMIRVGHPKLLKQTALAKRFGVTQGMISKDFQKVRQYLNKRIGKDFDSLFNNVCESAILNLVSEGDYYKAVKTGSLWLEFLQQRGFVDKVADKHMVLNATANLNEPMDENKRAAILRELEG